MTSAPPRLIPVKHLWAGSLWVLAVAMTLTGTIILLSGRDMALRIGLCFYMHGILVVAGASVMSIRNHVDNIAKLMHGAFTMGRDFERGELRRPTGL